MAKSLPYVNGYGGIPKLFSAIKKASVPPKFNQDFMSDVLGLKSSSYRAMIPLLKRLGFLDAANVPTDSYRQYRDDSIGPTVMASRIKDAYSDLYAAAEYAHKLAKPELTSKIKTLTGAADKDATVPASAATFSELVKLADFDKTHTHKKKEEKPEENKTKDGSGLASQKLGISYTINLNLPATTEIAVFNAIFKSLREYILND